MIHHSNLFKLGNFYPSGVILKGRTCPWVHALGDFSKSARKNEN